MLSCSDCEFIVVWYVFLLQVFGFVAFGCCGCVPIGWLPMLWLVVVLVVWLLLVVCGWLVFACGVWMLNLLDYVGFVFDFGNVVGMGYVVFGLFGCFWCGVFGLWLLVGCVCLCCFGVCVFVLFGCGFDVALVALCWVCLLELCVFVVSCACSLVLC